MLGLFAFFYVLLHFLTWLILDQDLYWAGILPDIAQRPFITIGFLALLLLIPLAVTSTNGMMRRLGRRWKTLHRLIYVIVLLGVWHYYWQVKADVREPLIYLRRSRLVAAAEWRRRGRSATGASARQRPADHIAVRIDHSSGKKRSSSALVRYDTPPVPPVPRL